MAVPCAALMCHAPIVIPAIGRERGDDCARTTAAMRTLASRLVAHAPDVLVVISPHAPRDPNRWGIVGDARITGDFGRFGVPQVGVALQGAPRAAELLTASAHANDLSTWQARGDDLDHGAVVPLYFLAEAGWRGPTLVIALPYPGTRTESVMGRAIAAAARRAGERWAVLASGDMSHRLQRDAPAGFHPRARDFDEGFRDLVAAGELQRACSFDGELRELAAEDVVDSCAVAAGAVGFDATGHALLAYEGPFGVGYMEAILHEPEPPTETASVRSDDAPPRELLHIARAAIAAYLRGEDYRPPQLAAPWQRSQGVFVTLRTRQGELRGCIGHIEPMHSTLAEEVAACAVSSAIHDTRFAPVTEHELDGLRIELSLLSAPERVTDRASLDAQRYGVVVSSGQRRGVLLPAIEGVHSVEQQLAIAARKAGIAPDAPYAMERFEVRKLSDDFDLH
jgi:AmmeMemoRadiSam system protein A